MSSVHSVSSAPDESIVADILRLETSYCRAVASGQVNDDVQRQAEEVFSRSLQALSVGALGQVALSHLRRVAGGIQAVSRGLLVLEQRCYEAERQVGENCRAVLTTQTRGSSETTIICEDLPDDPTTFAPYRQWFLDHLSNPYPTSKDKDALLKQVTVHTRRQLDTWYTNQRRRSGWHALKRKYGHISTLLKRIDEADEDDEEMQQARKEVERVKAYFKNDRQDHVRDEIREIISQGPPTTSTKRRIESGPPRRAVGKTVRPRSHFPANPPSAPAPLMPGSWTPYSAAQDDDFFSPAPTSRLQPTSRLPSDFTSPDSSRRTFSGSSSSSTDSLISYDSLDIPVSTPGPASPPASSSLLNFDGRSTFVPSSPARTSRQSPRRGSFVVRNSVYPTRPHPYFCTVNEPPTGSSLARFASS